MALSDAAKQEIDSLIRAASGGTRGATQGDYDAWGAKQADGRTYYDNANSSKSSAFSSGIADEIYASPEFAGRNSSVYDPTKVASQQTGLGLQTALALDYKGLAGGTNINVKNMLDQAGKDVESAYRGANTPVGYDRAGNASYTPKINYGAADNAQKLGDIYFKALGGGTRVGGISGLDVGKTLEGLGSAFKAQPQTQAPANQSVPTFTPQSSSVMGNISDVIKTDSPLMRLAETRAKQVANSRGLLNSSMAVQAGQDAILNVAMPIGQQQADQNFRSSEAELAFQRQQALQANDIRFQSAEKSLDRSLQEKLAGWQLNATEADNAARQVYGAQTLYQNTLVNINQNTALSAEVREQQIKAARDQFDTAMNLIEQIYRIDLNWAGGAA